MSDCKIRAAMEAADWQARSIGGVCLQICEHVPGAAEIIAADLDNPDMSLERCFGALKDYAREHQKGGYWGCGCAYWDVENPVIRVVADFYKIPLDGAEQETQAIGRTEQVGEDGVPRSSHPTRADDAALDLMELL